MPVIAIVGAGPGVGLSIAKLFGGHGFEVALIARSRESLDTLAAELGKPTMYSNLLAAPAVARTPG